MRRAVKIPHRYVRSVLVLGFASVVLCIVASTAGLIIRMRTRVISEIRSEPPESVSPTSQPAEIVSPTPKALTCDEQCIAHGFAPIVAVRKTVEDEKYCECDRTKIVFPSGGKPK